MSLEDSGVLQFQGLRLVNRASNGFAKILLVFFAVLFAAVLVHPDVDLLDVHDVKISNAHSQIRCVDGGVVLQVPVAFFRPQQEQPYRLECLRNAHEAGSSSDQNSPSVLRV